MVKVVKIIFRLKNGDDKTVCADFGDLDIGAVAAKIVSAAWFSCHDLMHQEWWAVQTSEIVSLRVRGAVID